MRISDGAVLGLVLMSGHILTGQNTPSAGTDESRSMPAPALSGVLGIEAAAVPEEDSNSDMPQIPALLGGARMSLALGSESERSNYLRGGINVGATYDDNTQMTPANPVSNTTYSIFPSISLDQARSRMRWTLGYAAGLTVNQRLSDRNQGSHNLNFESQFRLSPHVSLRVAEDFSLTSAFFDAGSAGGTGAGSGLNGNLITPLSKQRSSSTVAEISYHFALKDVIGGSGSFHDLHFSNVSAGALTNTRTAEGSAFWLHGLFGRDWAGLSYRFQRVTFEPNGETRVHSILAVNTARLPNRFTVTGYVGPEYSENQGQIAGSGESAPTAFSSWSLAGGVDVGWQTERTSVTAGFARQINDGGGLLGVVRSQGVRGTLRQQLLPGWAVSAGASYGRNRAVNVVSSDNATSINAGSVNVALERNLGKSLGLRMGYAHDFQEQIGTANSVFAGTAKRNQYFVTLGYQWARPLGR